MTNTHTITQLWTEVFNYKTFFYVPLHSKVKCHEFNLSLRPIHFKDAVSSCVSAPLTLLPFHPSFSARCSLLIVLSSPLPPSVFHFLALKAFTPTLCHFLMRKAQSSGALRAWLMRTRSLLWHHFATFVCFLPLSFLFILRITTKLQGCKKAEQRSNYLFNCCWLLRIFFTEEPITPNRKQALWYFNIYCRIGFIFHRMHSSNMSFVWLLCYDLKTAEAVCL